MTQDLTTIEYNDDAASQVAPGYYRCLFETDHFDAGDYVRVVSVQDGTVAYQWRDESYRAPINEFLDDFTPDPAGEQAFLSAMAQTMAEIQELGQDAARLQDALRGVTLYAGVGDDTAGTEAISALVPITDRTPTGLKRALETVRQMAVRNSELLKHKQTELQAMLAEQMAAALAAVAPLQEMVTKIQNSIDTVNLYLGKDEQIMLLADGAPAPADTPIAIRQLVLSMDQECAVAAEDGGIDSNAIKQFDKWLVADKRHLDQVLPELKGVVALVPRWESKRYEDMGRQRDAVDGDMQTYLLIRNGDKLFRIWTGFIVGKHLVPREQDFLDLFYEKDWRTGERKPLKPGTREYMQAEKSAEAHNRHYMRVGLILQGLIDRTTVFHPLPGPVMVTNQQSHDAGWVRFINDGELMLGDGHERFNDWMARINGELVPGMRIIGNFAGWTNDSYSFRGMHDYKDSRGHPRLHPSGGDYPKTHALYTVEGRRGDGFYFLYDRGEIWSNRHGYHEAEKRASCEIKTGDRFYLAFDATTIEEMEYYLRSRLDRHAYVTMFPLLKTAIKLKHQEAAEEAPFRLLLIGEIVKAHQVDHADAEALIDDLIRWWKHKVKNHRTLVGVTEHTLKALSMIVDEFAVRTREAENRERRREKGEFVAVRDQVLGLYPNALLIAHKGGAEYVALVPHNDQNVYVRELTLTLKRTVEDKPWRIVDKRHLRWGIFYTSERWPSWRINASRSEYLTDDERDLLGMRMVEAELKTMKQVNTRDGNDYVPLVVSYDPDNDVYHFYYQDRNATRGWSPRSDGPNPVTVKVIVCQWARTTGMDVKLNERLHRSASDWGKDRPWRAGTYRAGTERGWNKMCASAERIFWQDDEAIARVDADHHQYLAAQREVNAWNSRRHAFDRHLEAQWLEARELERYTDFLKEYRDIELWEGHKKTLKPLKYPHNRNQPLEQLIAAAAKNPGDDWTGLTVAEVRELLDLDLDIPADVLGLTIVAPRKETA